MKPQRREYGLELQNIDVSTRITKVFAAVRQSGDGRLIGEVYTCKPSSSTAAFGIAIHLSSRTPPTEHWHRTQVLALPMFLTSCYKAIVVRNPAFVAAIDEAGEALPRRFPPQ